MGKKEMELHEKVREAIGDQKVIGFVTGFSLFKKLAGTVVMTESGIVFCGRKSTGSFITDKTGIPFQQITSATYSLNMGVPNFSVTTQSGKQELVLGGQKKDVHEPAMALFEALKAFSGQPPLRSNIKLILKIRIPVNNRSIGDLDTFVSGVCDSLMKRDPRSKLYEETWSNPEYQDVHPDKRIAIVDDSQVIDIQAEKVIGDLNQQRYEVMLEGE